jgi:hypothetical protein
MRIAELASDDERQRRNTAATALGRARDKYLAWGLIDIDNPYVWLTGKKVKGWDDDVIQHVARPRTEVDDDDDVANLV